MPQNNKISFTAEVAAPALSRTALVENGGVYNAIWKKDDPLTIFQVKDASSRTSFKTTVAEDAAQISVVAEFEATEAAEFAYILASPSGSMNGACTYMAFTLPADQAPVSMDSFDGAADFLVSKAVVRNAQPAGEAITFEVGRLSAIGKVTIKNLPLAAGDKVKSVKFTSAQSIAGKITKVMLEDLRAGTYPLPYEVSTVANSITVTLPEAQAGDFTYYMSCWPVTLVAGEAYSVTIVTEQTEYVKEGSIPADLVFSAGDVTSFTVNMKAPGDDPDVPPVAPTNEPITVAGITWAGGNLEYVKDGQADAGFAAGWRIAPGQYHHFHIGKSGNLADLTTYDQVAHFNFGGVAAPFNNAAESSVLIATTEPAFDFSGKMYKDQTCVAVTTDFAEAKYGDIAYWASNGQYRMPTAAEFKTLYENASRTKATYQVDGEVVSGTYFFDPKPGESPVIDEENVKSLTDDDLKAGLFLPWSGRAYEASDFTLSGVNTIGVYRTSTVNLNSTLEKTHGALYRVSYIVESEKNSAGIGGAFYNKSWGATARYAIRPIYIGK